MSLKRLLDMFPAAQSTVLLQTYLPIGVQEADR